MTIEEREFSLSQAAIEFGLDYHALRGAAATGDLESITRGDAQKRPRRLVTRTQVNKWIERVEARGGEVIRTGSNEV